MGRLGIICVAHGASIRVTSQMSTEVPLPESGRSSRREISIRMRHASCDLQLSLSTQCQSESVPFTVTEPTWLMGRYYVIFHTDIEGALSNQLHIDWLVNTTDSVTIIF